MQRIKVNAYEVGLVFRDGKLEKIITTGTYWFRYRYKVEVYNILQPFLPAMDLAVLLTNQELADLLIVTEVQDNEMVLVMENGLAKTILQPGRYAYWKSPVRYTFMRFNMETVDVPADVPSALLTRGPLAAFVRSIDVAPHENALLFVNGVFREILHPGIYFFLRNAIPVNVIKADMRKQAVDISGQEILTRDKAALRINAWAQYRITDAAQALLYTREYDKQLYVRLQLVLREFISGLSFDELLEKKDSVGLQVKEKLATDLTALGVELDNVGIRDIILPGDMREIMNQVLVAEKKAQANSITRREETAATRSLLNTAKLMEENAILWKLKEMEYVEKIADKISAININGNGTLADQLKQIFITQ